MGEILSKRTVCDGLDVTCTFGDGSVRLLHFPADTKDVEEACAGVEQREVDRAKVVDEELEGKKASLEREVGEIQTALEAKKGELSSVTAAIAAKEKPGKKEKAA